MTLPVLPAAPARARPDRLDRVHAVAGALQLMSMFTPAARVRLHGVIPFSQLPNAGVALVVLGMLTVLVTFRANRWWRWIPAALSAVIVAVAYWKIVHEPSGYFIDPLVRRLVHPAWGFIPMWIAILMSLGVAARPRREGSEGAEPMLPV